MGIMLADNSDDIFCFDKLCPNLSDAHICEFGPLGRVGRALCCHYIQNAVIYRNIKQPKHKFLPHEMREKSIKFFLSFFSRLVAAAARKRFICFLHLSVYAFYNKICYGALCDDDGAYIDIITLLLPRCLLQNRTN